MSLSLRGNNVVPQGITVSIGEKFLAKSIHVGIVAPRV